MKNSEQPAYPHTPDNLSTTSPIHGGLTKREMMAAMAMQGLLTNGYGEDTAKIAVECADELLKQLENKTT